MRGAIATSRNGVGRGAAVRCLVGAALYVALLPVSSSWAQGGVGDACAANSDCLASNCIDGVCCDSFCFGTCRSCALAKTGLSDGACAQVLSGQQTTNGCSAAGEACSTIGCVPTHCFNAAKDGDETDVDCGGSCPGCDVAGACTTHGDCLVGNCVDGLCCPPSCFATCQSCAAAKTGQDDGACGPVLPGVQTTNGCSAAGQACSSIGCVPAHCFSGVTDGNETDVDCGGACPGCEVARACSTNNDCALGNCIDGRCCDLSCFGTCRSCAGAKTGEQDGTCAPVLTGQQTTSGCSAVGQACSSVGCVPTHCFSGVTDGNETDVDCGGSCPGCDVPNTCTVNADCATENCIDGICCERTCFGTCRSCALATTGQPNGICAQVQTGLQTTNGCQAAGEACTDLGTCENPMSPTATPTEIPTQDGGPTPTATSETPTMPADTPTPTASEAPATPADTPTPTATTFATPTQTPQATSTSAFTPLPPTATPSATPTDVPSPTTTGSPTEPPTPTPTPIPARCVGDCDGGNSVTIEEIVRMVNLALDSAGAASCPAGDANGDGRIAINELVAAVGSALNGCPPPASVGLRRRVPPVRPRTRQASPASDPLPSPHLKLIRQPGALRWERQASVPVGASAGGPAARSARPAARDGCRSHWGGAWHAVATDPATTSPEFRA